MNIQTFGETIKKINIIFLKLFLTNWFRAETFILHLAIATNCNLILIFAGVLVPLF